MSKDPINLFSRRRILMGGVALTAAALVPASTFGATEGAKKLKGKDISMKSVQFLNNGIKMAGKNTPQSCVFIPAVA
jgi:hypothetical protein